MKKPFNETRLGKILNKVKDIGLDVAPIVAKASTGNVTGAISDTIQILKGDNSLESNEILDELVLKKKEIELDFYRSQNIQVSNRWKSDMSSDSWLSKNVRPITLLYLLLVFTILVIFDSINNEFQVKIGWVSLVESLLITVVVAYFGSRGAEKVMRKK